MCSLVGLICRSPYPTVPVCTLLPSDSVISGILAPKTAEFKAARSVFGLEAMLLVLLLCVEGIVFTGL